VADATSDGDGQGRDAGAPARITLSNPVLPNARPDIDTQLYKIISYPDNQP
jgi:hypothetical protein